MDSSTGVVKHTLSTSGTSSFYSDLNIGGVLSVTGGIYSGSSPVVTDADVYTRTAADAKFATLTSLAAKASLASPAFTGAPTLTGSVIVSGNVTSSSNMVSNFIVANGASQVTVNDNLSVAGTLSVTGAITGNASSASTLQTSRNTNGVAFDGSANITVADRTKLPLTGGTLTGQLVSTRSGGDGQA